jgi:hypothetical protein
VSDVNPVEAAEAHNAPSTTTVAQGRVETEYDASAIQVLEGPGHVHRLDR